MAKFKMHAERAGQDHPASKQDLQDREAASLFNEAYAAYMRTSAPKDLLSRKEFRTGYWSDATFIRELLPDESYETYLMLMGLTRPEPEPNRPGGDDISAYDDSSLEQELRAGLVEMIDHEKGCSAQTGPEDNPGAVPEDVHVTDAGDGGLPDMLLPEAIMEGQPACVEEPFVEDAVSRICSTEQLTADIMAAAEKYGLGAEKTVQDDMDYIFSEPDIVAKLRVSIFKDPADASADDELRRMGMDEVFEQLLRVAGVARQIPQIIAVAHQVFLREITEEAAALPRKRCAELLMEAFEWIRRLTHYEYGVGFEESLKSALNIRDDEYARLHVKSGIGGKEAVLLEVVEKGETVLYLLDNAAYEQAKGVLLQLSSCSVYGVKPDIRKFLEAYGIQSQETESNGRVAFSYRIDTGELLCL